MGLFDKMVETASKKVLIETVGKVAVSAIDALGRNQFVKIPNVQVPMCSEDCIGKNAEDLMNSFIAHGFTDVVLLPLHDLINGWIVKDGSVKGVTINGKDTFKKKSAFASNSKVVITYHTFKVKSK